MRSLKRMLCPRTALFHSALRLAGGTASLDDDLTLVEACIDGEAEVELVVSERRVYPDSDCDEVYDDLDDEDTIT